MPIVRKSLFRHIYGQVYKRDKIYESISLCRASTDSNMCAVNPKFVAIITEASGGGSFLVQPLEKYGRVDINAPRVCGHKMIVMDIAWCPHNDNIIASCSEDTTIKIWCIPDEGLEEPMVESEQTLVGHQKKVQCIQWNPLAENILLSYAQDDLLYIWDVAVAEVLLSIPHPATIFSATWNPSGNLIGTSCKDRQFRIIDARTGDVKQSGEGFEGAKPQKIQLLKNDRAIAVGASKRGQRQYRLYNTNDMNKPMMSENVDNGNNTFHIFYDPDLNLVYLAAKGDCKLLYYEITDEEPYIHFLELFQPKEALRGMAMMPKRGVNVNEHEVALFYRLRDRGVCEPTAMIVPRKSELFQNDIYPSSVSPEPSMTTEEWIGGANKPGKRFDMESVFKGAVNAAPAAKRSSRLGRSTAASTPATKTAPTPVSTPKSAPVSTHPPKVEIPRASTVSNQESKEQKKQIDDLIAEVAKLKATVKEQGDRIASLEDAQMEVNGD